MLKLKGKHVTFPIAVKAGAGYLIGNILLRGIFFLTAPIFTRLMSPDAYGVYTVYLSYESFFSIILLLGLSGSIRMAKIDFKERFDEYISNISFVVTMNCLLALILVNVLCLFNIRFLGFGQGLANVLVLHCYFDNLIHIYSVKLSTTYQYREYLAISFVSTTINVALSLLLIKFVCDGAPEHGRIIGTFVGMASVGIYAVASIIKRNRSFFSKDILRHAISYSLPLMVHSISLTVLSQFDRIMISRISGFTQAGIYSIIYSFGGCVSLIWGSIDTSWTQWVFDKLECDKVEAVRKTGKVYVWVTFALTTCVMLVMPEVLKLMLSEDYHSGTPLFAPICSGIFLNFLYTFYVQIENFSRKTKLVAVGTVMAGLVNIVLNLVFIDRYGYAAAAYTTIASYFALFLYHIIAVKICVKRKVYCDGEMILTGIAMIIVGILVNVFLGAVVIRFALAAMIGIFVALRFLRYLRNM